MEDLKKKVKKYFMVFSIFIMPYAIICGCGLKAQEKRTTCIDTKTGSNVTEAAENGKTVNKRTEKEEKKNLYKKVPVYGKNEKKKIKKYLASLPDNLTVEKAKEKGIVIENIVIEKDNIKNPFQDMWLDFYKYTREGEKTAIKQEKLRQNGTIICLAEPYAAAIVVLRYTIEGDPCYTYISFIEDEYYVFNDSSRDKFKAVSWDGYSETGTFKSLRKIRNTINCKEDNGSYIYTSYVLFKKQGVSKKKARQIIKTDTGYNKHCEVFSYRTRAKEQNKYKYFLTGQVKIPAFSTYSGKYSIFSL